MKSHWLIAGLVALMTIAATGSSLAADAENTLVLNTSGGEVRIALRPDLAPKHVAQIKKLVRDGEYDNVAFHRVIEGFMAQTGDVQFGDMEEGYTPQRVGTGGSNLPDLPAEFSNESFDRGVVGMARAQDPNSANSQFFIMFAPAPHLNGAYTIIGQVESGMDAVDAIKQGSPAANGSVDNPDRIISAKIAAD